MPFLETLSTQIRCGTLVNLVRVDSRVQLSCRCNISHLQPQNISTTIIKNKSFSIIKEILQTIDILKKQNVQPASP